MYTFVCYDRCGTCRKAEKFLQEHRIEYVKRPIKEEKPTVEELKEWQAASGRELRKFFNTSGQLYRSMKIKEQLKSLSDEEIFNLLASDGMLVKRPVLVGNGMVLVGFNEGEWSEKLL